MKRTNSPDKNISLFRRMIILIATVITAIAVGVTLSLCLDDVTMRGLESAGQGEVRTSATNLGALQNADFVNKVNAGQVVSGDYLSYSYNGSYYTIQLPKGTYKFEVWGARGGGLGNDTGGSGGYAYGQIVVSATTTYYIYCGGVGANSTSTIDGNNDNTHYAGGYNGGGNGTGSAGPGGGGATDIRTTSGTASTASSYNTRIIVAAGGGGGSSATTSGACATTGTATSTGYERKTEVLWQGENGCTGGTAMRHSASYSNDEGGGGGGYYGGAIKHADDAKCGYAGSNYVSSAFTSTGNSYAQNAAAGKAQITAIEINQMPTSKNASVNLNARGGSSTAIAASTLASDPEGTTVAFTANSSANYDTLPGANAGLWVDSACSSLATNYFDWSWATSTLTITNVKRYPRSGVDGSTADGKLVLYTYVRDSFGSSTGRGVTKISFTVTVPVNTVSLNTGVVSGQSYVGSSTTTTAPVDPAAESGIYNPNGTGRNTLFIKKSLVVNQAYTTITAASLLSGTTISNGLDMAVISINDTSVVTGSSRKYRIQEVDNNTGKVTAYLANKTAIANAYSQLTIECVSPDPNYQVLPITIYTVEKTTAFGSSYANAVPGIATISLEIVFKMENSRPTLLAAASTAIDVNVGETKPLTLNTYFTDLDGAITTSTHSITGVIVPSYEFVLISKQQKVVAATGYNIGYTVGDTVSGDPFTTTATGTTPTNFNNNIAYNSTSPVSGTSPEQAFMSFTYSGITLNVTGLRASFSQYSQSRAGAIGHFYLLMHIQDNREVEDKGIWLPLAFTVGATTSYTPVASVASPGALTSQNAVSEFPSADGAPNDTFYFAPMAVNYNGSHVIGQYKAEDEDGNNTGALTNANLQAIALDGDNFATETGLKSWNGGYLNEFLTLTTTPEALVNSIVAGSARQVGNGWENQYIRAETIPIYIKNDMFANAAYSGGRIVAASGTDANGYIYRTFTQSDESGYYTIDGLKITLKSATMNRYIYAQVSVSDVTNKSVTGVKIAIRVKNTALGIYSASSGNVVTFGNEERDSSYSTYEYDDENGGTPTFTYKIPYDGTVVITPYDLAYDYDMQTAGASSAGGFTLNGFSGWYDSASGALNLGATGSGVPFNGLFGNSHNANATSFLGTIENTTPVTKVSTDITGTASNSAITDGANMYRDKLFFEHTTSGSDAFSYNPTSFSDFNISKSNTTNFVDVYCGTTVRIGDAPYSVDFIMITALNRTTQPSVIELVIRDRYGSGSSDGSSSAVVRIMIEVVNTKPTIKDEYRYEELSVKPISSGDSVVTPDTALIYANGNGEQLGLMIDRDRDVPEFILQSGVLIVNKNFVDDYNSNNLLDEDDEKIDNLYFDSFDNLSEKYLYLNYGAAGQMLLTNFISAEILSRSQLSVTAISSTKAIEGGVYVAFFVTDNNGGISLGYVRIEVLNTAPALNESDEDGFDRENPMWRIESTSDGDIMRSRYIVGSTLAADKLKTERAALDIDIKLIALDEDGLHSKVILSQIISTGNNEAQAPIYSYINLDRSEGDPSGEALRTALNAAVPSVGRDASAFNGNPSAIKVFDTLEQASNAFNNFTTEIYFWMGDTESGTWYERSALIDAIVGGYVTLNDCFDASGRFIVADWALHLHATSGFQDDENIGISFSLRDQAEFGGDTAGLDTAYNSDRREGTDIVDGKLITTVYQHISQTGIRSINEFLGQNNNYYTVEYTPAGSDSTPVRFISTYDGNVASTYGETQPSLYFKDDGTENHKMVLDNTGGTDATLIKSRTSGSADNTLAGTNSGAIYNGTGEVDGAFRYSDTIEIPAVLDSGSAALATGNSSDVKYKSVYVPMSYFGLLTTLVGAKTETGSEYGSVVYPTDEYVGYAMEVGMSFDLTDTDAILSTMTLSDGSYVWTGSSIADNPYIKIETFDWYHDGNPETNSARLATDPYSSAYYNNRLAVPTLSPDDDSLIGYEQYEPNRKSFVGDGRLMYLEEQATKLIEHNFGLIFTKKNVRTSTRSLTLTINLARCKGSEVAANNGVIDEKDKRTVEIKIHVENSPMDLYYNNFVDDVNGNSGTVQYDTEKGTYYMDLTLASSSSWSYTLSRKASANDSPVRDGHTIEYFDDDYGTADKRDYAYFSSDSFAQLNMWQVGADGYNRVKLLNDAKTKFQNVLATSDRAQRSIANYFGAGYDGSLDDDIEDISGTYRANDGTYSNTGRDGYSSYFNASVTNGGTTLNVLPIHKTWINEIAFTKDGGIKLDDGTTVTTSSSQVDVAKAYAERGLIAEYNNALTNPITPDRVYYPFKVIIFDSYGVGFLDASYVAIEFRIQITNGDPVLKEVGDAVGAGREYTMNLAVNNTVDINLYDIVYDTDIFTYNTKGVGRLATAAEFESLAGGVELETGDYLMSPLVKDEYKGMPYNPSVQVDADGKYYYNGAGFSTAADNRDVVMSMVAEGDQPVSNIISFKVNRRTTASYNGRGVSVDRYKFTLRFYDSENRPTAPFTFIINITNQTPSVTQITRSFTMRTGDDLTVLTSYYDVFTGSRGGIYDAYLNSDTYRAMAARENTDGYGDGFGDGYNNDLGNSVYWKYNEITSDDEGANIISNSNNSSLYPRNKHLGYVGLANDDTPWRLRFTNWTESNDRIYVYSQGFLALNPEGATSGAQQIALRILAVSACTNEPFTVTISDGEGGIVTCTLYITIVSSPPVARDCSDITDNQTVTGAGLEGVFNSNGGVEEGVFATYIVPAAGGPYTFNVSGVGQKTARRDTVVKMSTVAKDPDGDNETNNMRLYGNGEFELHDIQANTWQTIVSGSGGVYYTPYFYITPSPNRESFTITATGYDPDTTDGYSEIRFRVEDFGDNSYANTILITLRVYTLYSDLTNPTAAEKSNSAYTGYLQGSDSVNVKSYDMYFDPDNRVEESKYAFVKLVGNAGNDDNTLSPIVDPDATNVGDASYNVRLYAFFDIEDDGSVKALSADTIRGMLERDASKKTLSLKSGENYSSYLVGGLLADGTNITVGTGSAAERRLNMLLNYADFVFSRDGTMLTLTPRASTLNSPEFLLYIEAEKPLGNRAYKRTDAVLNAGALFKLNVRNSAPRAVEGRHEVDGVKGTVGTFTVFDPTDRYGALFIDSDSGDNVTVVGIVNGELAESEYANVMREATDTMPGLDWQAGENGKPRAFDISVNDAGKLQVTINRRIDYIVNGVYQPSVTIPLNITGRDVVGDTVVTTVYLTIHNSNMSTVASYTHDDEETQVGYTFLRGDNDEPTINVRLRYGVPLEISLADFLIDNDMDSNYDADSYRFVLPESQGGYTYLTDERIEVNSYPIGPDGIPNIDDPKQLAFAEPIGADSMHRTGILFTASETERNITATVYVRIIDRSADEKLASNGVIIKINVSVMNDAPYVLEGKETTVIYMIGTEDDDSEPEAMLFFIGDFVADRNISDVVGDEASARNPNTALRISRQESRVVNELYSQRYETIPDSLGITDEVTSTALFEVTLPTQLDQNLINDYIRRMGKGEDFVKDTTNNFNQWFVIRPRKGFYGYGSVDITVVDGNANEMYDTLSTTFCLEVHVISNPDEVIDNLVDIELACSKTKQIDIRSIMPDLENRLNIDKAGGSADGNADYGMFSQYEYYEIVNIKFRNESDVGKGEFTKLDESGQIWQIKAGNQVTRDPVSVEVIFALRSDTSVTYRKYFYLNVIANVAPKLRYSEIEFKRHTDSEDIDALRDLNEANSIRLQAWQLFEDADDPDGTAIRYLSVSSKVSSIVKATLIKDENGEYKYLEITFVARGESEITVTITDETGAPVQLKFMAINNDLPEASLWVRLAASFEANTVMWIIIIGAAVLVLVILIVIIAVARKRKREREEIEALLISEMEIEEQMLKLAGGPSPMDYQSYGYLPGAGAAPQPDPSMMLGAGAQAPQQQLTALPPAGDTPPTDNGGEAPM